MKKYFVYIFCLFILFGISTKIFAQNTKANSAGGFSQTSGGVLGGSLINDYYPTTGGLKIIKKQGSTVYGENTKAIFNFDMSDEKTYGNVFQIFQITLLETNSTKKIFTGDFSIDGNKKLSGTITGLIPNTKYTLFIKPYVKGTPKDVQMSIGFTTTNSSMALKSFIYNRKQTSIVLTAIYESIPNDSTVVFDISAVNGFVNKQDITPNKTESISQTTKQYTYTESNIPQVGAYTVTVKLKDKDGNILNYQTKTTPDTIEGTATQDKKNALDSKDDYQFLTKIPGLNIESLCKEKSEDGKCLVYSFDDYLKTLINLTYSLIALIAVFQIMYYGIKTMISVTPFGKTESKERVYNAIMGIVIALGSYLILYTINPNLTTIHLGAPKIEITTNGTIFSLIGEGQVKMYDSIGGENFKRTNYYNQIKSFVANMNYPGHTDKIPHCLAQVAIQRESGGNPNVIGHDENVASPSIGSRVTFIKSGKKQSGSVFTPDNNLIT
ncbi:MAG: hypothetical protein ACR2IQ_01580, partial [Minisyncoccia bacterium]